MKKNKSILFLTDNFPPEVNAPATRTFEHTRQWVAKGYRVTVITCNPNFPNGKVYDGYKNKFLSKEIIDGIIVLRVWTYIAPNQGFIKRIIDYMSFAIMAFIIGLFTRAGVIVATSPQFFTAISGCLLSFFKFKPWIMEVRDLWPESILAVGAMKKGFIYNILELIEIGLYRSAKKIIVVTDSFKNKIISKGISSKKIKVHKNGVCLDTFKITLKDSELLKLYPQLKNKKIFGYVGTHGMAHGLSFILECLPMVMKILPEIHFIFIGDGAEKQNLIRQSQDLNLKNVTFVSSVPKNEVIRYLSLIDVSLVNLKKSETFKSVIPSKIFEAAALSKPILLGLEGESKKLIGQFNCGLCYEPENKHQFIEQCKNILDTRNYTNFQAGCLNLANAYNRKKIALKILKTITTDL